MDGTTARRTYMMELKVAFCNSVKAHKKQKENPDTSITVQMPYRRANIPTKTQ